MDQRFNVGVEGARQDGLGGMLDHLGDGAAGLGRMGDAAHSVQVAGSGGPATRRTTGGLLRELVDQTVLGNAVELERNPARARPVDRPVP